MLYIIIVVILFVYFVLIIIDSVYFFFFFSSRRRHTRFDCDWSSDVCSSDLSKRKALLRHIYDHPAITEDRDRSVKCLEELFAYYLAKPGSMPASYEELEIGRASCRERV